MTAQPDAAPLDLAAPWGGRGHVADLGGPVHWVEFDGPYAAGLAAADPSPPGSERSPAPLVLVHGLGGSHLNWVQVAPALAEHRRVVAIDLVGFGLTPSAGRDTGVRANAALLARFVREVVGAPVVLVGNSMGGMVSLLLADSDPDLVAGLVLVDPSIPTGLASLDRLVALQFGLYATPVVGRRFLQGLRSRYTAQERVLGTIRLCFADVSRADQAVLDVGAELLTYRDTVPDAEAEFLRAAKSLIAVLRRGRSYSALIHGISRPVLLIHGDRDRLVPIAAARRAAALNPDWETAWFSGVGHTPQLEVPGLFLERVIPWLDDVGSD